MKLTLRILSVFAFTLLLASCSTGPEKVAEDFLNALDKKDFAKAKELSTPGSLQIIELVEKFSALDTSTAESKAKKVSKCEISGEKAVCTYCCSDDEKESTVNLVQVDKKWKVDMSKESLMGGQSPFDAMGGEEEDAGEVIEGDTAAMPTDSM